MPSTLHIEETEYGLLPTPTASAIGENQSNHQIHVSKDGTAKPIRESGIKGISNLYATLQVRGMLQTPTATEIGISKDRIEKRTAYRKSIGREYAPGNLLEQIQVMLPIPTAMDSTSATANMKSSQIKEGSMRSMTLSRMILKTPTASDKNMHWKTENWKGDDLGSQINEMLGTRSHLNPQFVAEMMGFPPNWTKLPFQSGDKNQSKDMETQ